MKLSLSRIAEITGAQKDKFDPNAIAIGYSIDSRTIRPGELFFAVKGEKMDGHDFVSQALEKGAGAAVVARERLSELSLDAFSCDNRWNGRAGTLASPQSTQAKLIPLQDAREPLQPL